MRRNVLAALLATVAFSQAPLMGIPLVDAEGHGVAENLWEHEGLAVTYYDPSTFDFGITLTIEEGDQAGSYEVTSSDSALLEALWQAAQGGGVAVRVRGHVDEWNLFVMTAFEVRS